jgi:hypothetical protein
MTGSDAHPTTAGASTTSTGQTGTSTGLGHTDHSATGTSTSAGATGTSTGLGHTEHRGTEGPLGTHSNVASDSSRPGAGHMHEGMSTASIKSGVIGFGTGQRQEHAALPLHHNAEENLDRNQIVGGGNMGPGPTTTATGDQPSTLKQALPRT